MKRFLNDEEKLFWQQAVLAMLTAGKDAGRAIESADYAMERFRSRNQ